MENGKWKIRIEDWWSEKMTRVYLIRSLTLVLDMKKLEDLCRKK